MTIVYSTPMKNDRLQVVADAADAGSGAAILLVCDGTRPAFGGALTTVLTTITCNDPCFNTPAAAAMSINGTPSDPSADDTGTATWFRLTDSDSNTVMDGNVGDDMQISKIEIDAGDEITVQSFTITAGS